MSAIAANILGIILRLGIYVYMYVCMYVYIYIYTYIHIHTCFAILMNIDEK